MASETETPKLEGFPVRTYDKLRYADTDRQGHVNNAVFATLLETGRAELLHPDGGSLAAPGCAFAIVKLTLEFRAEINWPGRVEIGSRVVSVGRSSVTLAQALFQDGRLVATGESVIVQMDETTRKSAPLLAETVAHLESLKTPGA
jgi:acyl-CoA thioester hydrolase